MHVLDANHADAEPIVADGVRDRSNDAALLAECYAELRQISGKLLSGDRRVLIQPTELAHETALRLLQLEKIRVVDRTHLLALAARIARQALIDEVRRAGRAKRRAPGPLTLMPDAPEPIRLEVLHEAINALEAVSPDHARLVELRFSLGMTIEEAAAASGLSVRTVRRRWQATRAWLQDWLDQHDD